MFPEKCETRESPVEEPGAGGVSCDERSWQRADGVAEKECVSFTVEVGNFVGVEW